MKKNLRIVSVAAAALLAVAPVAAAGVSSVSADAVQSATNIGPVPGLSNGDALNVKPSISLNTSVNNGNITSVPAAISASFDVTVNGTTATSTLKPTVSSLELKNSKGTEITPSNFNAEVNEAAAGDKFTVTLKEVGLNFGTKNANKDVTLNFGSDASAVVDADGKEVKTDNGVVKVTLDKNGVVNFKSVTFTTVAKNFADPAVITWHSANTGAPVTSANFQLYAGADDGKMNIAQVLNAVPVGTRKANGYFATQLDNDGSKINYTNNLKDALKAAGVEVDAQGWFVAPKSFTFNYTATSTMNNASKTLPVTVSVPNGKEVTPATVAQVGTVKIMHAAYTYELKDGKLTRVTSADTLHAYNVIPYYGTTTVNGKKYYRVSGEHEWYINAGNVDGTSRTLNHNSYVYNNKGKRVKSEGTWKKGSKHTTYGAAMNIKGNRMYRVGENRYVKVVNFDKN